MKADFEKGARAALEGGASLDELRELLRGAAARGLSREDARQVLENMRSTAGNEAVEDRILEVLDIVTDFCPPQSRVHWTR